VVQLQRECRLVVLVHLVAAYGEGMSPRVGVRWSRPRAPRWAHSPTAGARWRRRRPGRLVGIPARLPAAAGRRRLAHPHGLPDGHDPAGLAQQHGPGALLTVLDAAGPLDLQGGPLQHPRALGPI